MRKTPAWIVLVFVLATFAVWGSAALNYLDRQQLTQANWNNTQALLVRNAAAAARASFESSQFPDLAGSQAVHNLAEHFAGSIHLLPGSNAWIYQNGLWIYAQHSEMPAESGGKSIAQVFAAQQPFGASGYDNLVQSVASGASGTGFYTWLPQTGPEAAAWTTMTINDEAWTFGLSTPLSEVAAFYGQQYDLKRELFGAGAVTLLLWCIFFLLLRQHKLLELTRKLTQDTPLASNGLTQQYVSQSAELAHANTELERASIAREEFLANMGHELRTPLSTIIGLSYALKCQVYGPVTDRQARSLETILKTSQHLSSLVTDILDMSKLQAGEIKLEIRPFKLTALLESCQVFVDQQTFQKNMKLAIKLDEQVSIIEGDALRLKQLMINLLNNAVKFTPEGGLIGIDIAADPETKQVSLTVWDTGIGIAEEDMPRLFKPFVQLDSGTARQFTGTGLGLSLVVGIAEMHGGSVSLASEPGKGSQFSLHLPWSGNLENAPEPQASKIVDLLGQAERPETEARILIAVDPSQNNPLIAEFLTALGYQVFYTGSAPDVLHLARECKPDLIYLDMHMAGMDGIKMIEAIRTNSEIGPAAVLAVSSLILPGDPDRTLQAGASAFLQRPIQVDRVAGLIHSLVGRVREVVR